MTIVRARQGAIRRTLETLTALATNAIASVLPLVFVVSSTKVLGEVWGGTAAFTTTLAAFATQLVVAGIVEMRLAGQSQAVKVPKWLLGVGLLGTLLWLCGLLHPWLGLLGVVPVLVAVEASRAVSVVSKQSLADIVATALIGGSAAAVYVAPSRITLWVALPICALTAVLLRERRISSEATPARAIKGSHWVLWETAATGISQPLVTGLVLAFMGPGQVVAFRLIAGVLNVFSPVLSYARLRLLRAYSRFDIYLAILLLALMALVLSAGQAIGLWDSVLGTPWRGVTWIALVAACCWKFAVLASTIPFAKMRRLGRVRTVFVLRLISSGLYAVLGAGAVMFQLGVTSVFVAFVLAEACAALIYWIGSAPAGKGLFGLTNS